MNPFVHFFRKNLGDYIFQAREVAWEIKKSDRICYVTVKDLHLSPANLSLIKEILEGENPKCRALFDLKTKYGDQEY